MRKGRGVSSAPQRGAQQHLQLLAVLRAPVEELKQPQLPGLCRLRNLDVAREGAASHKVGEEARVRLDELERLGAGHKDLAPLQHPHHGELGRDGELRRQPL